MQKYIKDLKNRPQPKCSNFEAISFKENSCVHSFSPSACILPQVHSKTLLLLFFGAVVAIGFSCYLSSAGLLKPKRLKPF